MGRGRKTANEERRDAENTMKRSDLNKRMILEVQNWGKGIGRETCGKKAERGISDTSSNESEKEDPGQGKKEIPNMGVPKMAPAL